MKTIEQTTAEQATGIAENKLGIGPCYAHPVSRLKPGRFKDGDVLSTLEDRQDHIQAGGTVAYPNAGAGSYHTVAEQLGYQEAQAVETSSSSGDWTLAFYDGVSWYVVYQTNRYPYHGFDYSVDTTHDFASVDALCESCF